MESGIYVHIPFCPAKCDYCTFVSVPLDAALAARYHRALLRELEDFEVPHGANAEVGSIYLGGGTPSLLPAEQIEGILALCRKRFAVGGACEITMEANPGTVTREKSDAYRRIGINRVSVGAQSFEDGELAALGRRHRADDVAVAFHILRESGFENLNLDLILGLPGQTRRQWKRNLESATRLAPAHLSVYMLEVGPGTPLDRRISQGGLEVPCDDAVADWYLETIEFLESRRYRQYEISNFSQPGFECRHNLKYWRREPVLAFGAAAHSFDGATRYANVSNLLSYIERLEAGRSPVEWREDVSGERSVEEAVFLGLRLNRGLDGSLLRRMWPCHRAAACNAALDRLTESGLLEWNGPVVSLSKKGMLLSNEVFRHFV